MNNTIRTFIAIPLDPKIRQTIAQAQNHLRELDCNIKWVNPENIHLTLKFLGEVKLKKIDAVKQSLEDLLGSVKPLPIELTQLGAFPDVKRPRIIWVGLNDDTKAISQLVSALEETLEKIGFKKEGRPFSPHITIGRIQSLKNLNLLSPEISGYSLPPDLRQTISHITLYKSTLTSDGPIYDALKISHFSNA
ncbi:MAG: RNA 2',3'-cyclic phosphodiesterase [Candidatus Omnitrophica bacterium]|nr:RNA 2',3'-cyclic phosphodiesterase [Candidatus Omnitrophota bacterium]